MAAPAGSNRRQRRDRDVTHEIEGRYAPAALALLRAHDVRVCHWRRAMSGIAWIGNPRRPIEAPHPRSPLSFAVLAHEVGHHALGAVRPRWREEYLAWEFAVEAMRRLGVPVDTRVRQRHAAAMRYALHKALRRGLREVPTELQPFIAGDYSGVQSYWSPLSDGAPAWAGTRYRGYGRG